VLETFTEHHDRKSVLTASQPAPTDSHILKRTIQSGDNLSSIFAQVKISQTVMLQIVAADESLLALDILRPGNILTFTLDKKTQKLQKMELFIHPAHQVIYQRVDDSSFEYKEIILAGTWKYQLLDSDIEGSFYQSAISAGLSEREVGNITYLFKNKVNFSRDIRAGDRFQVVRNLQLLDGKLTGQSHIEAIRIFSRKHHYSAFLFEDGNYYDEKGKSLARAFRRYPFKGHHRITSPFNLARRHPITKRISPHKGVDFGMPVGTPVYSTGDGVVTRVKNHPYAGKYIEIRHEGRYLTRYMHLSRFTVKRGDKVKRGERIALSGNTGRSTGPHLHYEIHIKGRAVNPLTAKIPLAVSVPKGKLKAFKKRIAELNVLLEQSQYDLIGS
jgi:murein DD-endopeptidase